MRMYVCFKTVNGVLCLDRGYIPAKKEVVKLNPIPIKELLTPVRHDGNNFYLMDDDDGNLMKWEVGHESRA